MSGAGDAQAQPFTFQPPAGGDITLKSSDGVTFDAHSVILGVASTVFSGMFSSATKANPVELAEGAESIALMLAFIYPVSPPRITTIDQLEKIMAAAQKYDIQKMIEFVEETVKLGSGLMALDPMRIFYLSVIHNFPNIQVLTAESIGPKNCDLLTVDGLLQLTNYFPRAASVIGLAGAQGVRVRILTQVLIRSPGTYGCYQLWTLGNDYNHGATLPTCRTHSNYTQGRQSVPDYCKLWLRRLYDELMEKPMHECSDIFGVSSLMSLDDQRCNSCIVAVMGRRASFEQWTSVIKKIIKKELKVLDVLYSL